MDTEPKPGPANPNKSRGHEKTDINVAWIFAIVVCLAILGLALHFITIGLLGHLKNKPAPSDAWMPRTAQNNDLSFPRLQVSPPADLQAFRAREEAELNSYGWIDEAAGRVRLPIEQAMRQLLQKQLPVRSGPNADKLGPTSYELRQQWLPQEKSKK
jgi:hypothetical protein